MALPSEMSLKPMSAVELHLKEKASTLVMFWLNTPLMEISELAVWSSVDSLEEDSTGAWKLLAGVVVEPWPKIKPAWMSSSVELLQLL